MTRIAGVCTFISIYCLLISCNSNNSRKQSPENHEFFPVQSFLNGQVHEVDSLRLPLIAYSTLNNHTDTTGITTDEFHQLAKQFTEFDINDPSLKNFYNESSFADQSIPSITINYSTKNRSLPLQRLDIIITPDPVLNDKVKSIYQEKISASNDTTIVNKLYWKTGKSFEIITSKQSLGRPALFSRLKVLWAPSD